jgi:hypothetical protein
LMDLYFKGEIPLADERWKAYEQSQSQQELPLGMQSEQLTPREY